MRTPAVPVRQDRGRNSVQRVAAKQKQAAPVLVAIGDVQVSISRPNSCVKAIVLAREVGMSESKHMRNQNFCKRGIHRWPGNAHRLVAIVMLSCLPTVLITTIGFPAASPGSNGEPVPDVAPKKPSVPGVPPPIAPSPIDPGIQHVPEKQGNPKGAVKPPDLDPGISKNPDAMLPANKESDPSGEAAPQKKLNVR